MSVTPKRGLWAPLGWDVRELIVSFQNVRLREPAVNRFGPASQGLEWFWENAGLQLEGLMDRQMRQDRASVHDDI